MSIASNFRTFHGLLSEGKYGALSWKILSKILPGSARNMIYFSLRRKYSPLISAHKSTELLTPGGGYDGKIWRLWLQGEDNAPEVCKACLRSLRYWHSDKKIITLDKNNISDYIDLPGYIIDKHEKGIISHTHFSDIIRAELLTQHGGTWIDATVYCTGRKFGDIMRLPLFVYQMKIFSCIASIGLKM